MAPRGFAVLEKEVSPYLFKVAAFQYATAGTQRLNDAFGDYAPGAACLILGLYRASVERRGHS